MKKRPLPPSRPAPAPEPLGVVELIRRIQQQQVAPSSLAIEDRQACVEYLTAEGYSVPEIAGILKSSDRTVLRDRRRVRESHALARDPALVDEMVGHLVNEADIAVSRLRRVARDREAPPAVKVEAEKGAWGVTRDLVQTLQRLGYLPTAATELRADLTHHLPPDAAELEAEVARVEAIIGETGAGAGDPALATQIVEVKDSMLRLRLAGRVRAIEQTLQSKDGDHHEASIDPPQR